MPEPIVLEGRFVRLEPLSEAHIDHLAAAASEDRSNYQWSTAPNGRAETERYVADALRNVASGDQIAFATVRRGGGTADRVVGSTRFYEVATWQWADGSPHQRTGTPDAVDIGYTWLAASAQRSPVNTEAKLLMLSHAFEVWHVHRVGFLTDERNTRSRKAIERIGGQLDGLLRADRPGTDDTVRTSARFSILAAEWPEVKDRLTSRLGRGAETSLG
jgi:RimJ/RimL family protein N-acetyltransferase